MSTPTPQPARGPTKVWLDCDPGKQQSTPTHPPTPFHPLTHRQPLDAATHVLISSGHDDAFAILLAAHHPGLELLGLSTVHGNSSLTNTTANAGSVVTAIGRPHIPIYPGAATPFCRTAVHAADIHGISGLDGTSHLPTPLIPPITSTPAIIAMHDALSAQPAGTAWLVATGTLTNVALLFAMYPGLATHIKGLSIMGGAIGGGFTEAPTGSVAGEVGERFGNRTRFAEFNIYVDPESAQAIFVNPVLAPKTVLIPLDLTHTALADEAVRQLVLHGSDGPGTGEEPSALRRLMYEIMCYTTKTYAEVFGIMAGPPLHDALAMAYVMFAEGLEGDLGFEDRGERWAVEVVTDGMHSEVEEERGEVGRTVAMPLKAGEGGIVIPRGLEVREFWRMLDGCVGTAEVAARGG